MELQLTADQNEWRDEVRDFLDTELPGGTPQVKRMVLTTRGLGLPR